MGKSQPSKRTCPRCGDRTGANYCCGIDLSARRRPWMMTPENIKLIHVLKARKGLDEETYRLRLAAVGVESCKHLSRGAFRQFLAGLAELPDSPTWFARAQQRKARG